MFCYVTGMLFDISKLLKDHFGDASSTHKLLQSYGYTDVAWFRVYQWFRRGSLPAEWLGILLSIRYQETGKPVPLTSYLR